MHVKWEHVIPRTEGLLQADHVLKTMETLTQRNRDLEARVEALEVVHVKLLDGLLKEIMHIGNDCMSWFV